MAEKMWNGFKVEEFDFEGKLAAVVFPEKPNGKGYFTIKTEYRDASPKRKSSY